MSSQQPKPIIIRKKKIVKHGGHHGGAWKVAYADFVTAMMSLFIVLWLMNSNAKVKEAIAGYFKDPAGVGKLSGTDKDGRDRTAQPGPIEQLAQRDQSKLIADIKKALEKLPEWQKLKDHIVISMTDEGVRLDLMDDAKGLFFSVGSETPTQEGGKVLETVGVLIGKLPNRVTLEGHTDALQYRPDVKYSNWELSSARANSARVLMENAGMRSTQLLQIRGFADQQLRIPDQPVNPSNRRISVIIVNLPGQVAQGAQGSSGGSTKPASR